MRYARRCNGARQGWSEHAANERSWREAYVGAAQGPIAILEEIKRSNLRGRGGAGFTTGVKWEACRQATGLTRYVVCNADEGEPGTFKDRVLLTSHADLVFEGMTVAAYVIGASLGFLYLRGEYRYLLEPLEAMLQRRRAPACWATASAANRVSISTSTSTSARARTSAARSRRSSSRSRASAACRAIVRRIPVDERLSRSSRRSSTTSRRSAPLR